MKLETKSAKQLEAEALAKQVAEAKDAFGQFQQELRGLPKDIASAVTESLISAEHKPLELAEGQKVTVMDFDKAHQTINEIRERVVAESKAAVRKDDLKPDPKLISALNGLDKATQALSKREFKVVVNAPETVSIENWPTKVSEALPVRLVDAEGKKFYTALLQGVNDVVGGILGARSSSGSGGGAGFEIVGLKDANDTTINPATADNQNPLDKYRITDVEKGVTHNYYGFTDKDGAWYILRETVAGTEYRYAKGASAYTTAWTDRATQTYDYFYNIF